MAKIFDTIELTNATCTFCFLDIQRYCANKLFFILNSILNKTSLILFLVNISSSALSSSSQMYNQDLLTPSYEMTLSPITKSDPTFITSSRRMFYDYDHNENRSSVEEINQVRFFLILSFFVFSYNELVQ